MITIWETFNYNVCRSYHQTQCCRIRCNSFHCHQICYQNTAQSDATAFTAIESATKEYCAVAFGGYGSAKYNATTLFDRIISMQTKGGPCCMITPRSASVSMPLFTDRSPSSEESFSWFFSQHCLACVGKDNALHQEFIHECFISKPSPCLTR